MSASFFKRWLSAARSGHLGVQPDSRGGGRLALRVALLSWLLSTFLAPPLFLSWTWEETLVHTRAGDFLRQCVDPFARHLREPILSYRVAIPLLARLLHLDGIAALALPYLAHIGFLAVVFAAVRRRTDANIAQWLTLTVALSFALFWPNWVLGSPDSVTHLLIACMLLTLARHYSALALFLGLLNDERAILAVPFVALWHYPMGGTLVDAWQKLKVWLGAIAAALTAYLLFRRALAAGWIGPGIPDPTIYKGIGRSFITLQPWLGSWGVWALNVFLSFRWAWIVVVAFVAYLATQRRWLVLGIYGGALVASCSATIVVADVARSVSFCFPAWLLAGVMLYAANPELWRRRLALIVWALIVTPVFYVGEHFTHSWHRPLPLELVRMINRR